MSSGQLATVIRRIRTLANLQEVEGRSDSQLLQDFAVREDHNAFAVLMKRHGPMVWRLCRRILQNEHDTEDAFQATFLVLARKAASIHKGKAIVSWLHGVAHRVAMKAIRNAARQREHQGQAKIVPQASPHWDAVWREVQGILDEEIQRLPERYRVTFLLCCIEGQSRADAARELGVEEATVRSRLARARQQLQKRLALRGVELGMVLATMALSPNAHASVRAALFSSTVKAATLFTADKAIATGLVSAKALTLAKGVGEAMLMTNVKLGSIVLALGIALAGVFMGIQSHVAGRQADASEPLSKPRAVSQFSAIANPAPEASNADERDEPKRTIIISGQVLDPDGQPCPNAKLYVFGNAHQEKATPPSRTTTGPDGRFRFSVTEAEAKAGRVVATAKGYGPDLATVAIPGKGELILRVVRDDVPINGRIVDLQGRPVTGATVRVVVLGKTTEGGDLSSWVEGEIRPLKNTGYAAERGLISIASPPIEAPTSATTDKEGRFQLKGPGRNRALVLEIHGPSIERRRIWVTTLAIPPKVLESSVGLYGPTFEHVAGPARALGGKVTDKETGKPVPGVRIIGSVPSMGYARGLQIEANTDQQGNYQLEGLPKDREYYITADTLQGLTYLPQEQTHPDPVGLKLLTVNFTLERGTLVEGRLKDQETGRPVSGTVRYFPLPGNQYFKATAQGKFAMLIRAHRPVGDDGSFKLLVFPGPGLVCGYGERGVYVPASVSAEDGKIGVGGTIFLGDERMMGVERMNGEANHIIRPGEKAERLVFDLELVKGRKLSGTVLNSDGKPIAGIQTDAIWSDSPLRFTIDDRTGSFTADGIPTHGARKLVFFQPMQKLAACVEVRGDAKDPIVVRLQPWGHVEGRILDLEGRPLPGAKVRAGIFLQNARVDLPKPVTSDADGRFRLEGLIPGLKTTLVVYAPLKKDDRTTRPIHQVRDISIEPGEITKLGDLRIRELEK